MNPTAIPIADNGTTYLEVPEKPSEDSGEDNKGALYLRAGWGAQAVYKQEVKLPCAQYRLEYWIYNTNYAGSQNNTNVQNLCKIVCRKDEFVDTEGFNCQEWTKHTIEFTPTASFTMQFGFKSSGGSGSNPYILLDGIKLYKIGEADKVELLKSDLGDVIQSISEYSSENFYDYEALAEAISNKCGEFDELVAEDDEATLEKAVKDANDYLAYLQDMKEKVELLRNLIIDCETLLEETQYDGSDTFNEAIESASAVLSEEGSFEKVVSAYDELMKARIDYLFHRPFPCDVTRVIDNPTFIEKGAWEIGPSGGDQRIKADATNEEGETISCWNAWSNALTDATKYVSVQQNLTNLPNGYYTFTGKLCTQDGLITDQHLFAKSLIGTSVSPVMTTTGWDPMVWEKLTTEEILVVDGQLTIGAIGHGIEGGSTNGWFCLSDVSLTLERYISNEEVAAAKAKAFTDAESYASAMHFAADAESLKSQIASAKVSLDLIALNTALDEAKASEDVYESLINGSYKSLSDVIAENPTTNSSKISHKAIEVTNNYINSAKATSSEIENYTSALNYYYNTLYVALELVEANEIQNAKGKEYITEKIGEFVADLTNIKAIPATYQLEEKLAWLQQALADAQKTDVVYGDNTDLTALMNNPTVDSLNGWTVYKPVGDGNGRKTGQQYDGKTDGGYIDTYTGEAGALRATIYQTIYVPNGTYTVSNIMRNSGTTGVYLFAATGLDQDEAGNPTVPVINESAENRMTAAVANATDNKYIDGTEGETVTTDTYGEIWTEVASKVMANLNITGATAEGGSIIEQIYDKNNGNETRPDFIEEADWNILSANAGKGRGWFRVSVDDILVQNHLLVIGVSCDNQFTLADAFDGNWFSADNFKLTMVKAGNNADYDILSATAIDDVTSASAATSAIYSVTGARLSGLQKGINIIKMSDNTVKKVLVK